MFWSGDLLGATGPLAKVWQSANTGKISKQQILQTNIHDSVHAIIEPPEEAPFALRLSGQLLLGVARIYGRKARYLLDDCNDALMKIKMAFRSTAANNDLPANMPQPQKSSLNIPNRLTIFDDLGSLPPPNSSAMEDMPSASQSRKGRANRDINLQEDFNNSQFLMDNGAEEDELVLADNEDLDLNLDLGLDDDDERPSRVDKSIEMGRDAPVARSVEEDLLSDMDFGGPSKDRQAREASLGMDLDFGDGVQIADNDGDIQMGDDFFNIGEQSVAPFEPAMPGVPEIGRERISESPLSDIDEEFAKEIEMEYSRVHNTDLYEPEDDTAQTIKAPQRAKKRKLIQPDDETMLTSDMIREQQAKRDSILKAPSFLPRNAHLMALADMQKSGGFARNALYDGQSDAWAPELRGLLSLDAIRPPDRKRKRDSGIADMESDQDNAASKSPRLEVPEDETIGLGAGGDDVAANESAAANGTVLELPADDGQTFQDDDGQGAPQDFGTPGPNFDETHVPIVHPADSGPVSYATKHAVHVLRDIFGADAEHNAEKRKKATIVFQELLPESKATKAEATKMFFESLVLATKDAIKVEQPVGVLGAPIKIRAKRGLWGAWAEREAGGEIAKQDQPQPELQQDGSLDEDANNPEPVVASASAISVEA